MNDHAEQVLAEILRARDPGDALRRALEGDGLPEELRRALSAVDADGLRLAALLVARLRFERLVQGSTDAAAWFHRDPAAFSRAFRVYHTEVAPRACFPRGEAEAFVIWLRGSAVGRDV
jgi:hypothetical protein